MGQRVGFYLTDLQIKNLKLVSKKTGLTVSEIIRRAVDEHLKQYDLGGPVVRIIKFGKGKKPSPKP
ncbi:MAG: ribbon-helix-helix domain-containing protein [bacterium]